MPIDLRVHPGLLALLLAACSFDATGIATVGEGASSSTTADPETGDLTDASDPTVDPTSEPTSDATGDATTEPTTEPTATTPGNCGDGMLDPGEACDAGPANADTGACKLDCSLGVCGDGFTGPGEGCDDGNMVDDDACPNSCVSASCGDGKLDPGEECDDNNQIDEDTCTHACTLATCGDGFVQPPEQCDMGGSNGPNMACNAMCQQNVCGDGDQGPGEGCDDGNLVDGDMCSATCVPESCGDMKVQGMEQCDDGNMVDTDACTNACKNAACGDGIKADAEACDDGNMVDTDDCVACKVAVCGDGFVLAGKEECDDDNNVDNDACTNACKFNVKRVFVTSMEYKGNLGGVAGADTKCTQIANGAGLPGPYMAWISADADNTAPATRFTTKANVAYLKPNNEKVADNWADLIDGSLDSPIDVYENGADASGEQTVWTNVAANGTEDNDDVYECGDWSNNGLDGSIGNLTMTNGAWSNADAAGHTCNESRRLYCFQQ